LLKHVVEVMCLLMLISNLITFSWKCIGQIFLSVILWASFKIYCLALQSPKRDVEEADF